MSVPLRATKDKIHNPQAIAIIETTKSTVIAYIERMISMLEDRSVAVKAQRKASDERSDRKLSLSRIDKHIRGHDSLRSKASHGYQDQAWYPVHMQAPLASSGFNSS